MQNSNEKLRNNIRVIRLDDGSVKIESYFGTVIATSFYESRMNQLYDELKNASEYEVRGLMLQWYQSKLINFWAEFDLEKYLNI